MFHTRRSTKHTMVAAIVVLLCLASIRNAYAGRENVSSGIPVDVMLRQKTLAGDRTTVSADGRWIAFVTYTLPSTGEPVDTWRPGWVHNSVEGTTLMVAALGGQHPSSVGEPIRVGPSPANCWQPAFSHDSTQLAFYCDNGGRARLWIHSLSRNTNRLAADVTVKSKASLGEPIWNRDDSEVVVPLPTANERDRTNNVGLAAIHVASGRTRTLVLSSAAPTPSLLARLSPTGSWLSYVSISGRECAVVSARTGATRFVVDNLIREPGARYGARACQWHSTRDEIYWVKSGRLWSQKLSDVGVLQPSIAAPALSEVAVEPVSFSADGTYALVGTRPLNLREYRDPRPQTLAVLALPDGRTVSTVDLPQGLLFDRVLLRDPSTFWQPGDLAAIVTCRDATSRELVVARIDLVTGEFRELWRAFASIDSMAAPQDNRFLVARLEDTRTPRNLVAISRDFTQRRPLTNVDPRLSAISLGAVETFQTTIPQFDGSLTTVTSAVLLPEGAKIGDRLPTVVFHYPGSRFSELVSSFGGNQPASIPATVFTSRGYAALLVDLPIGAQNSPGNPMQEITDALVPQVYRAAELGYTDLKRVALVGHSSGGYGTAAAIAATNIFRAAVAISGFYDLPGTFPSLASNIHKRLAGTPWTDQQRFLDNSPYYRVDRIRTPLLLVHGESDPGCPVEEARKLYAALRALDRPVEIVTYEGQGHSVSQWSLPQAVDATNRVLIFLEKALRPS